MGYSNEEKHGDKIFMFFFFLVFVVVMAVVLFIVYSIVFSLVACKILFVMSCFIYGRIKEILF